MIQRLNEQFGFDENGNLRSLDDLFMEKAPMLHLDAN